MGRLCTVGYKVCSVIVLKLIENMQELSSTIQGGLWDLLLCLPTGPREEWATYAIGDLFNRKYRWFT